jgi:hypothetical protein
MEKLEIILGEDKNSHLQCTYGHVYIFQGTWCSWCNALDLCIEGSGLKTWCRFFHMLSSSLTSDQNLPWLPLLANISIMPCEWEQTQPAIFVLCSDFRYRLFTLDRHEETRKV